MKCHDGKNKFNLKIQNIFIIVFIFIFQICSAIVPDTINIRGILTEEDDSPLTGSRNYIIKLFDSETNGNQLGNTINGSVTLSSKGIFSIDLTLPPEALSSPEVWYEIGIDTDIPQDNDASDDFFPNRMKAHSVPFAIQANEALSANASAVGTGNVDNTEFSSLDGVTANIQIQLNSKANISDVYDKPTVDTMINSKANTGDVYDKNSINSFMDSKANSADVYLKNEIDTFFADLETTSTALSDVIKKHEAAINANTEDIAENSADIIKNNSAIKIITADINSMNVDISENTSDIFEHTLEINAHTAAIASNTSAIQNHSNRIDALEDAVTSNSQEIDALIVDTNANSTAIAANTSAINSNTAAIADSALKITKNTTDITSNTASINKIAAMTYSNIDDIEANTSAIAQQGILISANTADIAQNTSDISKNTSDIAQNTSDISQNTSDISKNTSDISKNTSDIAQFTLDIDKLTSDTAKNTSDIAQNKTDISKNSSDIAQNTSDIAQNTSDIALKANASDVYNKTSSDSRYVNTSGDTMTGNLSIDTALSIGTYFEITQHSAPSPTLNKLYNVSGDLYWNGLKINNAPSATAMNQGDNVSLLTNDAGYITNDTSVDKNHLNNSGTLSFSWSDSEVGNALTISGGTVNDNSFSAYSDLDTEGYLDNNANGDILTRTQADARYLNIAGGDSITGDFTVDTSTFYVDSGNNRVGINNTSPAEALDITGVVKISDTTSPPSTTTDKLYNNSGNLYWNGALINGVIPSVWSTNGTKIYYNTNFVGIGTNNPTINLHIYRNDATQDPAFRIQQASSGDAVQDYLLSSGQSISVGIDNDDNDNFKISKAAILTGTTYSDANTLVRYHTETGSEGIVDFNHQSRSRAYSSSNQAATGSAWTIVQMNAETYDEKSEFNTGTYTFTAKEDGYYQVNSSVTLLLSETATLDIAIFVSGSAYAMGTRYSNPNSGFGPDRLHVSDVVFLSAGNTVDVRVWYDMGTVTIKSGSAETFVSIHKIS